MSRHLISSLITFSLYLYFVPSLPISVAMAPHLSKQELDRVFTLFAKGEATTQILERITARRAKRGVEAPMLGAIQRALKGNTFKRGVKETRGRKRKLSKANTRQLDKTRKELIQKAKGEEEITWDRVIRDRKVSIALGSRNP
jgi:hypothetical protein